MTAKHPQSEPQIPPAFVIPGVSPKFPPSLLAAVETMTALTEIVAKARAGAEALDRKATELKRKAASLKEEIERADGAAAAAVAMGVERADPNRKSKVAAQIAELAAIERDIVETTRAQAAAPALFEDIREPLTAAVADFEREYAIAENALAEWASEALSVLDRATVAVRHFADGIKRHGAIAAQTKVCDLPAGHPLALFAQLREFHAAFAAAGVADRPLIARPANAAPVHEHHRVVRMIGGRN